MADPQTLVQQLVDAQARLKAVDRDGNHQFSRQEIAEAVIAQWPMLHPEDQDFSKLRAALALQQKVNTRPYPTGPSGILLQTAANAIGTGNNVGTGAELPKKMLEAMLRGNGIDRDTIAGMSGEIAAISDGVRYAHLLDHAVTGQLTQIAQTLDGMRTNLQTITQGQAESVTAKALGEGAARGASGDQTRMRAMMEAQLRAATKNMPAEEANKKIAEGLATLETKSAPSFAGRQAAAQTQAQAGMQLTPDQLSTINGIRHDMAQYQRPTETPTTSDLSAALNARQPGGRRP